MQTLAQLIALTHALRGRQVLTVYVDGSATNPAEQRAWRAQLDRSIADLRSWLQDSSHAERRELERCIGHLEEKLQGLGGAVGAAGWVAFVTADGVHEAARVPVPMPTRATWSTGASIAPYIRALKESRTVALAVVDSRQARLYRYENGALQRRGTVHAHRVAREPAHMGAAPQRGFHGGTRGETGRDAAQRGRLEGRLRMLERSAEHILKLAGSDGWILIGGIPATAHALVELLEVHAPRRVARVGGLDVHASESQLTKTARKGASALRNEADRAEIASIADHEAAAGVATLGSADTRRALDESRVRKLYLTNRFLGEHALEAEEAVRGAIAQGAAAEEVSGSAAVLLDSHGGMAARLRYGRP